MNPKTHWSQDGGLVTQKGKIEEPDICFLKELFEALGLLVKTREKCRWSAEWWWLRAPLPLAQPHSSLCAVSTSSGKASWISQPWLSLTSPPDCFISWSSEGTFQGSGNFCLPWGTSVPAEGPVIVEEPPLGRALHEETLRLDQRQNFLTLRAGAGQGRWP